MNPIDFGKCFNAVLDKIEEEHPMPDVFYRGLKECILGFLHGCFSHNAIKSVAKVLPREVANKVEIGSYFCFDKNEKRPLIVGLKDAASFFNMLAETIKQMYETDCGFEVEE
ncbi:MAG: hypothetical protein LBG22_09600 [Treponema sp.]|jgi:hypothetical protein|nr:hypothetical protein [Treponema sp.]